MNRYHYNPYWRITGVVASATGDVNGDMIPDSVYVTGYRGSEGFIIQNMVLGIREGATGVSISIPLKENMGYEPMLFLGDFTGDGINDILLPSLQVAVVERQTPIYILLLTMNHVYYSTRPPSTKRINMR